MKRVLFAIADETTGEIVNAFVKACDFEAHGGRGFVEFTPDESAALSFNSVNEAIEFWRTQSEVRPLRPDGKPNRPLTAYTVEVKQV
jgi:hypothetical protein